MRVTTYVFNGKIRKIICSPIALRKAKIAYNFGLLSAVGLNYPCYTLLTDTL